MARRRSFSIDREPVEFDLGGEDFVAPPVIAPAALAEMIDTQERLVEIQKAEGLSQRQQVEEMLKILDEVFAGILKPESASRFHERLYSRDDPLDLLREVVPCLEWLIEEYADRPTQPSLPSSTGLSDGGVTSTDGAQHGVLIPATCPPTGSSTSPTT